MNPTVSTSPQPAAKNQATDTATNTAMNAVTATTDSDRAATAPQRETIEQWLRWVEEAVSALEQSQICCEQKQWQTASQLCERAIHLFEPGAATAYRILGWAMQEQGNLAEAEQIFLKALAIQPDSAEVQARLGSVYAAKAEWDKAISHYQQAIALDPTFAGAYLKLGEVWQQIDDLDRAADSFYQAFQLKPDLAPASFYAQLADLLASQNKRDAAAQVYPIAAAGVPEQPSVWLNWIELQIQQGEQAGAIETCYQALLHHPTQPMLYTQLGNLLGQQKRQQEAAPLHRQAAALQGWQLAASRSYQFSHDWFTHNLPYWQSHLQPYAGQPDLQFLEIGSFEGMASCWLLDHILTHSSAHLTTIDLAYQPTFEANIAEAAAVEKVTKLVGNSHSLLLTLPSEHFDVIYIDGCHLANHVRQDAELSWMLLKSGGLMIFDDYVWSDPKFPGEDPRLGIDAFLSSIAGEFEKLHQQYQLIIRKY